MHCCKRILLIRARLLIKHVTLNKAHMHLTVGRTIQRETFEGEKLSRIGENYDYCRENFRGLVACALPKDTTPPNFTEKTFVNSHKTAKFTIVFSLKIFPLYGISLLGPHFRVDVRISSSRCLPRIVTTLEQLPCTWSKALSKINATLKQQPRLVHTAYTHLCKYLLTMVTKLALRLMLYESFQRLTAGLRGCANH